MNDEQMNLKVCPDCKRNQVKVRRYEEDCINSDCESYVTKDPKTGQLIWWNPNWDLPDDYEEEE